MSAATARAHVTAGGRFVLPRQARRGAILCLAAVALFIVLAALLVTTGEPPDPNASLSEQAVYYQSGGWVTWAVYVGMIPAAVTLVAGCMTLARAAMTRTRTLGLAVIALATISLVGAIWVSVGGIGLLAADPANPPAWTIVAVGGTGGTNLLANGIESMSLVIALTLLAFALRSAGLLSPRSGLVWGVIGCVLTVATAAVFFLPIGNTVLAIGLSLTLLLRRTA